MTPVDRMFVGIGKVVVQWTAVEKAMVKFIQANEVQDFPRQFADLVSLWKQTLGDEHSVITSDIDRLVNEALELHRLRNLIAHNAEYIGVLAGQDTAFLTFLTWNHRPWRKPAGDALLDEGHYLVHWAPNMDVIEVEDVVVRMDSLAQAFTRIHIAEGPKIEARRKSRWKPVNPRNLLSDQPEQSS